MARIAADKITLVDQKGLAVARPDGATGEPPTPKGKRGGVDKIAERFRPMEVE